MTWRTSTVLEPRVGRLSKAFQPVPATRRQACGGVSAAPLTCLHASEGIASLVEQDASDPAVTESSSRSQQQSSSSDGDDVWEYAAPQHVLERNKLFVEEQLKGRVILAPLTKGGNLPFRCGWCRLATCVLLHYGAATTERSGQTVAAAH